MNKKSSVRIKFILIFMFSIIFVCVCHNAGAVQNTDKKNNIEIAFISTISGEDAYHTETALNAIKMYTEKVNLEGGINGKKIDILVFDDEFSEKTAIEKANEIAYKTDALIVIGHRTSAMSIPAGEVYKKAEIPVISGSATADKLTKDNPFYFRVVANNSQQAEILAYYSKNILKKEVTLYGDKNNFHLEHIPFLNSL